MGERIGNAAPPFVVLEYIGPELTTPMNHEAWRWVHDHLHAKSENGAMENHHGEKSQIGINQDLHQ